MKPENAIRPKHHRTDDGGHVSRHGSPVAVKRLAAFISIPRNASKTVLGMLTLGPNRDQEFTDSPVIYENHQRGQVLNAKYDLKKLFVFCFSRNPYDRCVSWYEFHRQIEPYCHMTFESWVRAGLPHHWTQQNQTNYLHEGISPLSQASFAHECRIDFVGKIETFDRDIRTVIDQLSALSMREGLSRRFVHAPMRLNKSQRRSDFESYYTDVTKQMVYAQLQEDFVLFGYRR